MDITKIHKNEIVTNKNKYINNRQYKFVNSINESNLIEYELYVYLLYILRVKNNIKLNIEAYK